MGIRNKIEGGFAITSVDKIPVKFRKGWKKTVRGNAFTKYPLIASEMLKN